MITVGQNELASEAQDNLKELASEAKQHAARIELVFNTIVEADRLAKNADDRFTDICDALNNGIVSNGFRTLVMTAFTSETGLSFSFGNLGIVVLTTRQSFNAFAGYFFTRWALMVMISP